MSTHKAEVICIEEIKSHPNADSLGLIQIEGFEVCVRLGDFKIGDLALYIEPDSVVPDTKEFQFLKDLIEKSSMTNGEGLSSAASGEQTDIFDKLIDMLLLEIGNEEQLDRIVDDVITAVGLEDLSSNLEIIADVDEILKGLDDPDGPLDTIKTELTTLSNTANNLKTAFNDLTTTLESFVGDLIP